MTLTHFQQRLVVLGFCMLFYMTFTLEAARSWSTNSERNYDDLNVKRSQGQGRSRSSRNSRQNGNYGTGYEERGQRSRSAKPNIILIITDDQDELLGSMTTMTKTMKIMGQEGIHFNNSFVSTPMCCPSRSTLLTGMYPHNHHVYTNNDNCSGTEWQREHEPRTFAKYLSDAGYRTGFFGKYLNEYNGTYIPPGWREWVGLVKNSRFYNYTLNFNGQKVKHDDNYYRDYFTDLIANDSVTFMKQSKQYFSTKPVMMMLSVPAPHGPEDSAPQYQHMFEDNMLHRTPSWNYMNNSDKQWLVKEMTPMEPKGVAFTDILQRKRLQTLQSVDSLVEKVYYELRLLGELDNTYIIYTSDHGYHLGQFGIVKGKALPYDFDIRVPLYIRGPGVLRDTKIPNLVGNVDIAPTILDMAGIDIPDHMDGRSILKLMKTHKFDNNVKGRYVETRRPWRDTVLIERGKVTSKILKGYNRKKDDLILNEHSEALMPYVDPKMRRTLRICSDPLNNPPCKFEQKWVCFKDDRGRKRVKKCRNYNKTMLATNDYGYQKDSGFNVPTSSHDSPTVNMSKRCEEICSKKKARMSERLTPEEEELHRSFYGNEINDKDEYSSFLRLKRSTYDEQRKLNDLIFAQSLFRQRCRYFPNDTFTCDKEITNDPEKWHNHKLDIDEMIKETKVRLRHLKKIRKSMKRERKNMQDNYDYKDSEDVDDDDNLYDDDGEDDDVDYTRLDDDCDCEEEWKILVPPELSSVSSNNYEGEFGNSEEDDKIDYYNSNKGGKIDYDNSNKGSKKSSCNHDNLKCSIHLNDHWNTPPYWTLGPLCFCTNAVQNTYWCLRTVNTTHNYLYCEFIDSFLAFYDFTTDPHQLNNVIKTLDFGLMQELHEELTELRKCQGWKQCTKKKEDDEAKDESASRRRRRRKVKRHNRQRRHRRFLTK